MSKKENSHINLLKDIIKNKKDEVSDVPLFDKMENDTFVPNIPVVPKNEKARGRPKKNSKKILLTVSKGTYDDLLRTANLNGMEINDFIRNCIRKEIYK